MSDPFSLFNNYAEDNRISKDALITILQHLAIPPEQVQHVQENVHIDQIEYSQFYDLMKQFQQAEQQQPKYEPPISEQKEPEQEIPQQKLSQEQIQDIWLDFKTAIRSQNVGKVQQIIKLYQKDYNIVNRLDTQTRQISTYFAVIAIDENLAFEMLYALCEAGADVNFKDQMKQSILFYVCRDGRMKMLDYLLHKGISINDPDVHNQTPLFYACRDNRLEVVRRLIIAGADLNHVDTLQYQTCLFYAAREGHVEMCRMLIENGCKMSHQDSSRKTAQFYAKKNNRKDVLELFNQYSNKMKDEQQMAKKDSNIQSTFNENSKGEQQKQQKKKMREIHKQSYKVIYTDDQGNQKELTSEDFLKFQQQYPEISNLILRADELIDETMVNQIREDETWEKLAKKIITTLWKSKGAYFFHTPVDPKKYGIHDYFEIVKKPMDFGTIKNKLLANVYKSCREFYNDVMLVFENCILYNGTNSEVGMIGVSVKNEFQHLVESLNLTKYL